VPPPLGGPQPFFRSPPFPGDLSPPPLLPAPVSPAPACANTPLGGMGLTPAFGHGASYNRIGRNEPVIVDFASCYDGYMVDQTRVFSLGKPSDRILRGHADMLRIEALMMEMAESRPTWGSIYDACHSLACEMGYADNFMGGAGSQVSFIGHGIGIEIDEYPFMARGFKEETLEPGMAFAFEPKLVFPGEGDVQYEAIEVVVYRLRKKLAHTGTSLVTLRGLGYLLKAA